LTSSAFLKALESIKKFDLKKGKFASWLYRIARNTIIDHYRTQKRVYNISDAWELSSAADPLKDIANREELEKVRLFLQKLTPEQRDVILLRVWSNLSYAEIAEIMGKSEANCRMLFSRAISRIKTEKIFTILILLPLIKLFN